MVIVIIPVAFCEKFLYPAEIELCRFQSKRVRFLVIIRLQHNVTVKRGNAVPKITVLVFHAGKLNAYPIGLSVPVRFIVKGKLCLSVTVFIGFDDFRIGIIRRFKGKSLGGSTLVKLRGNLQRHGVPLRHYRVIGKRGVYRIGRLNVIPDRYMLFKHHVLAVKKLNGSIPCFIMICKSKA